MNEYLSNLEQNTLAIRKFLEVNNIEFNNDEGLDSGWIVNDFIISYNPVNDKYSITHAGGEHRIFTTRLKLYMYILKTQRS